MSRYIDADKAPSDMKEMPLGKQCIDAVMKLVIDRLPTADVVEVVRCKDCSHYIDGQCYVTNRSPLFKYNVNIHSRKANDYCSYGERRANNGKKSN